MNWTEAQINQIVNSKIVMHENKIHEFGVTKKLEMQWGTV